MLEFSLSKLRHFFRDHVHVRQSVWLFHLLSLYPLCLGHMQMCFVDLVHFIDMLAIKNVIIMYSGIN